MLCVSGQICACIYFTRRTKGISLASAKRDDVQGNISQMIYAYYNKRPMSDEQTITTPELEVVSVRLTISELSSTLTILKLAIKGANVYKFH